MQRRSGVSINREEDLPTEVSKQAKVLSHRAAETVITAYPHAQNFELYEQLEFTENTAITEDSERELELPKKQRLHFLDEVGTTSVHSMNAHEKEVKAVTLEHPTPSLQKSSYQHKSKKKETNTVATQTIMSVRPHIFEFGSRAHVYIEADSQTSVTCEPKLPDTNIITKLEFNKDVYPYSSGKEFARNRNDETSPQGHSKDFAVNFSSEALEDVMHLLLGVIEALRTEIHELSELDEIQKPIEEVGDVAGTKLRYDNIECECIPKERGAAPPTLNSETGFDTSLSQNIMFDQSEDGIDAITLDTKISCPCVRKNKKDVTAARVASEIEDSASGSHNSFCSSSCCCYGSTCSSKFTPETNTISPKNQVTCDDIRLPCDISADGSTCQSTTSWKHSGCDDVSCQYKRQSRSIGHCDHTDTKSSSEMKSDSYNYKTYQPNIPSTVMVCVNASCVTNPSKLPLTVASCDNTTRPPNAFICDHLTCLSRMRSPSVVENETNSTVCNDFTFKSKSAGSTTIKQVPIVPCDHSTYKSKLLKNVLYTDDKNQRKIEIIYAVGTKRTGKVINKVNGNGRNDSTSTLLHTNNSLYYRNQNYVFNPLNNIYENNQAVYSTGTLPTPSSIENEDSYNCCNTVDIYSSHKINLQEQSESINVRLRKSDVLVEIGNDLVEDYATLEATSDNTEYILKLSSKYPRFARNKTIIVDTNSSTPNRYCHGTINVAFKCVETQTQPILRQPKRFTENSMSMFKIHTVQSLVEACKDQMRPIRKALAQLSEKMRTVCNPEMRANLENLSRNCSYNNYDYCYDFRSASHKSRTHGYYKRKVSFDKNRGCRKFQTRNKCTSTSSFPILYDGPSQQQWSSEKELQTLYTCKDTKSSMSTITDCQFVSCREYDVSKFE